MERHIYAIYAMKQCCIVQYKVIGLCAQCKEGTHLGPGLRLRLVAAAASLSALPCAAPADEGTEPEAPQEAEAVQEQAHRLFVGSGCWQEVLRYLRVKHRIGDRGYSLYHVPYTLSPMPYTVNHLYPTNPESLGPRSAQPPTPTSQYAGS